MRVTVLTGGTSSERDVALASSVQVIGALRGRGHEVDTTGLEASNRALLEPRGDAGPQRGGPHVTERG